MRSIPILFLLWLLSTTSVRLYAQPFPKNAVVSLKLPGQANIGDPLVGEFVIQNTGKDTLNFALWDEIHVEAKDAQGNLLPHLEPPVFTAGFLAAPTVLGPGKAASVKIPLNRHIDIANPGVCVVSVWSALGWEMDSAHPSPLATARIEFQSPAPEYAAARVRTLCEKKHIEAEANSVGDQFEHLRDPHYLPALRSAAEAGHPEACFGIASVPGEEASSVLLKLGDSADPNVAKAALQGLLRRLPCPNDYRRLNLAGFSLGESETIRSSWPTKLDVPLLEMAVKILHSTHSADVPPAQRDFLLDGYFHLADTSIISPAATIVATRGGPPYAAAVLAALDQALFQRIEPRIDYRGAHDMLPGPLSALIDAIDALRRSGWYIEATHALSSVEPLEGAAGRLAFFRQLADPGFPKPHDEPWQSVVHGYLNDDSIVIRENALRAAPPSMAAEWETPVITALEDPDLGVVTAACQAAGRSGRRSFLRPLAQVVESIHTEEVRDAATDAAKPWEAARNFGKPGPTSSPTTTGSRKPSLICVWEPSIFLPRTAAVPATARPIALNASSCETRGTTF